MAPRSGEMVDKVAWVWAGETLRWGQQGLVLPRLSTRETESLMIHAAYFLIEMSAARKKAILQPSTGATCSWNESGGVRLEREGGEGLLGEASASSSRRGSANCSLLVSQICLPPVFIWHLKLRMILTFLKSCKIKTSKKMVHNPFWPFIEKACQCLL